MTMLKITLKYGRPYWKAITPITADVNPRPKAEAITLDSPPKPILNVKIEIIRKRIRKSIPVTIKPKANSTIALKEYVRPRRTKKKALIRKSISELNLLINSSIGSISEKVILMLKKEVIFSPLLKVKPKIQEASAPLPPIISVRE